MIVFFNLIIFDLIFSQKKECISKSDHDKKQDDHEVFDILKDFANNED
jgi:hypothetical protein